jgi:serine/threonine-protein kinase
MPLLQEARRLRIGQFGAQHGLVGDTDRLIGVVAAALGDPAQARSALQQAVALTRGHYGPGHPHTVRAELAQARLLAAEGDTAAMQRLAEIGTTGPVGGSDLRQDRWLARAYLTETRCQREPALARVQLDAITQEMQAAMPEGSAVLGEVHGIRQGCL